MVFSASSLSRVSTLRGSYCRSQRPVLDHGMLSGPGFFNPFHCLNSRVKFACEMSMCMSTAQACTRSGLGFGSSEGLVLLPRHARFLSYVHFVWQAWGIWGILKSGTSLCMAGARLGAWQPWHSRRVAKALAGVGENHFAWQAAGAVFGEHGCTLKGSKSRFVKLSSFLILDMMVVPCGRCSTSDASGSLFVAGAVLCRPRQKSG